VVASTEYESEKEEDAKRGGGVVVVVKKDGSKVVGMLEKRLDTPCKIRSKN